ncbi:serine hydrolase [Lysinibacillus sphaericus]|uniref:D-alanyl-D-alanine carboxypeptidase n=1 Tax=Lysinibacillus sphaericus OT4b.31 TaxID=1285586 RepID=R7ZHQ4_LYSSH|nr:serine hydrolase [Lysinibacillus sphaericus]EON73620.1 D-alanyl-D-alanine carboxypeptidase [Lysinibacillus sphaericus OT4b.31]
MNIYFTILLAVLLGVLLLFIGFILLGFFMKRKDINKTKDDIIKLMEKNPEMWSMSVIQNDNEIITYNKDKIIPLASTVKILYAVAFINAVRNKFLNPDELVPVKEVDSLYLKNTDGNAHNLWKENEHIGSEVTLKEIAKGMMKYSSNACTDFIYYRLGKDKIDAVIKEYSLLQQTEIYPINSAILIPSYLYIAEKVPKKNIAQTIKDMPISHFNLLATELLNKIIKGEANRFIENLHMMSTMKVQRELTKKLPAASSSDYAKLMYQLGKSEKLTTVDKQLLDDLMGFTDYEKSGKRLWYKGGATLFVLTSAGFRSNDSENISFSFFIEDMSALETIWIEKKYNEFIKAFLEDNLFRTKILNVIDEINNKNA